MLRCAARPLARVATRRAVRPYHQEVIDHFEKPLNVGSLDKDAKDVGTGLVGTSVALACRRAGLGVLLSDRSDEQKEALRQIALAAIAAGTNEGRSSMRSG